MKGRPTLLCIALATLTTGCNVDKIIEPDEPNQPTICPVEPSVASGKVSFSTPSYFQSTTTRYTVPGRAVYLRPDLRNIEGDSFAWYVDATAVECSTRTLVYTPAPGSHTVRVVVDGTDAAEVEVVCIDADQNALRRHNDAPFTARVMEWVPAPGQFINDKMPATMPPAEAFGWADAALSKGEGVSLGAFGGYIILSMSRPTEQFSITGNAFRSGTGTSNEPGIVYVMQDLNGNGLPDEEWYQLRASETDAEGTVDYYSVTYSRPTACADTPWTGSDGEEGVIKYVPTFHSQDYYYPSWISADTYTLTGTRIASRTKENSPGLWANEPYEWGYADNDGDDALPRADGRQRTPFDVARAMYPDHTPAPIEYADFVKIQTAVQANSGWLGEISTEILGLDILK